MKVQMPPIKQNLMLRMQALGVGTLRIELSWGNEDIYFYKDADNQLSSADINNRDPHLESELQNWVDKDPKLQSLSNSHEEGHTVLYDFEESLVSVEYWEKVTEIVTSPKEYQPMIFE